jgi:hypothetical protein
MVICTCFSPCPVVMPQCCGCHRLSCVTICHPVIHCWHWGILWSSKHLLSTLQAVAHSGGGCWVPLSCPFHCHLGLLWFLSPFIVVVIPHHCCPLVLRHPVVPLWPLWSCHSCHCHWCPPLSLACFFVIPQHLPLLFCHPTVAHYPHWCSPVIFAFPCHHCSCFVGVLVWQSCCCK